ncbi:MAG: hypothetical protein ACW99A_12335 [Candidatus Kariarchaeaceae archaeon]|jgi:hypothetical protein
MQDVNSSNNNAWPFDLPKVGTWFYFLIIGYPISIILLLVDSIYIPFTDKPNFIHNLSKYSMSYNGPYQEIEYYKRSNGQKVILGFAGFVLGVIILTFSLVLSIFGAFKQAADLQENIILTIFPTFLTTESKPQQKTDTKTEVAMESAGLTKTCAACGEPNQVNSEFCIGCGSNLPAKQI